MAKTLDQKLQAISSGNYSPSDFVIADAKDGDMAFGVTAPGPNSTTQHQWKTRQEHLSAITDMTNTGLIDIMLMSVSTAERLKATNLFTNSSVTPAVRMNDTTDIWMARGSRYRDQPSVPFSTTDVETASTLCDLGLYSMTFANDLDADLNSLNAYKQYRKSARPSNFAHFLEVFNPAFDIGLQMQDLGHYVNDMIIKAVAGLASNDAPKFLKIQFNGHAAMEELARYDPQHLIVGILGGSQGTTRDTFELAFQAEAAGARVALFGRKINLAESPHNLVELMRSCIEGTLTPEAAVAEYHKLLDDQNIKPQRSLADDQQVTDPALQL